MISLYITSFNAPSQFEAIVDSIRDYDQNFLKCTRKILINNSTDNSFDDYQSICVREGFEHLKFDNIGIMKARLTAARHFQESISQYYFYFEDDMMMKFEGQTDSGFLRGSSDLYNKMIEIMKKEEFDFLKMSFDEVKMSHEYDWIETLKKNPIVGLRLKEMVKTTFYHISSHRSLSYAEGNIYLSNWPTLMSRLGNQKTYLSDVFDGLSESNVSTELHRKITQRKIRSAVLLLSPISHNRLIKYGGCRKEF
jgi:hypothetical protein